MGMSRDFLKKIITFNNWNWIIFNVHIHSFQTTPYMIIFQEFWKIQLRPINTKYLIIVWD